jgi:hypothetical protein
VARTGALIVDGERVAVEIELRMNGKVSLVGDFFTLRNGRIERLHLQPDHPPEQPALNFCMSIGFRNCNDGSRLLGCDRHDGCRRGRAPRGDLPHARGQGESVSALRGDSRERRVRFAAAWDSWSSAGTKTASGCCVMRGFGKGEMGPIWEAYGLTEAQWLERFPDFERRMTSMLGLDPARSHPPAPARCKGVHPEDRREPASRHREAHRRAARPSSTARST